jgi:uncharacterized membrane protein YhaH (DUF805 family)
VHVTHKTMQRESDPVARPLYDAAMGFDLSWYFFSFKGRISRREFWLGYLGLMFVLVVLFRPLGEAVHYLAESADAVSDLDAPSAGLIIIVMIALWPTCAIYIKRLHDLDLSGWYICVLPAIGLAEVVIGFDTANVVTSAVIIALGSFPGSPGANRFGDDPQGQAAK